jgi:hypothetical protein
MKSEDLEKYRTTITRPPLDEVDKATQGGYMTCTCGVVLTTPVIVAVHWEEGHMDSNTFWSVKT